MHIKTSFVSVLLMDSIVPTMQGIKEMEEQSKEVPLFTSLFESCVTSC